jgi:hypothetical protein
VNAKKILKNSLWKKEKKKNITPPVFVARSKIM